MTDLHQLGGGVYSLGTASRRQADFVAGLAPLPVFSAHSGQVSFQHLRFGGFFCEPVDLLLFCQPDGDWLLRQ